MNHKTLEELVSWAKSEVEATAGNRPVATGPKDPASRDSALARLLGLIYPDLMGYLVKMTGDFHLSEDLCQETMVRIIKKLPEYKSEGRKPGAFRAWAMKIAVNLYRDYRRRLFTGMLKYSLGAAIRLDLNRTNQPSAETLAIQNLGFADLVKVLSCLPPEQREVFILKTYYGYSYREIAEITGCPEGTAKSRFHKAVETLREELERRDMV